MIKKLNLRSEFLKSVMVLTSGTILGQVLSYAVAPIVTRLFTPEEMGEFGVFLRIVTLISTVATARYELSLPLPKSDSHSFQLFRLSLRIGIITTLITLIGVVVYWSFTNFGFVNILFGLSLVVGTYFLVFYNVGSNWAVRVKAFKRISYSKVIRSISNNGLRVGFGLLHLGSIGLILAFVISVVISTVYFMSDYFKNARREAYRASKAKMKVLSKTYNDFPKINMPHVLMDSGREVLIAMFIIFFFDKEIFGSYDHSFRMLQLPLVVIGSAIGQVFFNKASELFKNKQELAPLVRRMTLNLTAISIPIFTVIFFFGEPLFAFVFGADWRQAGILSEIMAPWLMFKFITSPLSTLPIVVEKQRSFFIIGLVGSVMQLVGFGLIPYLMSESVEGHLLFHLVSLSQAALYIYVIFYLLNLAKNADAKNLVN